MRILFHLAYVYSWKYLLWLSIMGFLLMLRWLNCKAHFLKCLFCFYMVAYSKEKVPNSNLFPCHWIFSHDFYLVPNIFLLFAEKIQVHEPKGRVIKERHLQMGIVLASWNEHSKSEMVEVYINIIQNLFRFYFCSGWRNG